MRASLIAAFMGISAGATKKPKKPKKDKGK